MRKVQINIDGMMCDHCVAHVKEALERAGATDVEVSLESGTAKAMTESSDSDIKGMIEEEGYTVISIEE